MTGTLLKESVYRPLIYKVEIYRKSGTLDVKDLNMIKWYSGQELGEVSKRCIKLQRVHFGILLKTTF